MRTTATGAQYRPFNRSLTFSDADGFGSGAGFAWGGALYTGLLGVLLTQKIGWWAGIHPGGWSLAAGALAAGLATMMHMMTRDAAMSRKLSGLWLVGALLAGAIFFMFQGKHDPSWDGPAYHAPAVVHMLQGWNPVYGETGLWIIDQYPNGAWAIRAALVGVAGGDLAAGRMLTVLAAMGLFAMTAEFAAATLRARRTAAVAVALLVVLNPVVISQVWTDYVDGLLGIYALSYLLALMAMRGARPRWALATAAALAVLTATTKAAGLYYIFVITFLMLLWHVWHGLGRRNGLRETLMRFTVLTAAVVLLLVITAWRPYATNLQDYGSLIYPPVDKILGDQRPSNLHDAGPGTRAVYLFFSEGRSGRGQGDPLSLRPFDISRSAIKSSIHDARSGGFGPFFGLQAVLAAGLVLWAAASGRIRDGRVYYAAIVCLAATAAFPESWWARFVPLAWAATILLAAPMLAGFNSSGRIQRGVAAVFVVLALLNVMPFAHVGWERMQTRTHAFTALAGELENEPGVALKGCKDNFFHVSYGYMLAQAGITVVTGAQCTGDVLHTGYYGLLTVCRVNHVNGAGTPGQSSSSSP